MSKNDITIHPSAPGESMVNFPRHVFLHSPHTQYQYSLWASWHKYTLNLTKLYFILFYVFECFVCISIYVPCAYLVLTETRRGHQIPWDSTKRWVWNTTWVLRIETKSCGRTVLLTAEKSISRQSFLFNQSRSNYIHSPNHQCLSTELPQYPPAFLRATRKNKQKLYRKLIWLC